MNNYGLRHENLANFKEIQALCGLQSLEIPFFGPKSLKYLEVLLNSLTLTQYSFIISCSTI